MKMRVSFSDPNHYEAIVDRLTRKADPILKSSMERRDCFRQAAGSACLFNPEGLYNRRPEFRKDYLLRQTMKTQPVNQSLDIRSTPRDEMKLVPLDTFAYEYPGRTIWVDFAIPEFTAICPFSDFPDFGTIRLKYVPNQRCVELKSLKLYINSFRDVKIFHEHAVNLILEDLIKACDPLRVEIEGDFNIRGNIKTVVRASYQKA